MSYELIRESFPVARKPHRCIWCGGVITMGLKHVHEISKYDDLQDHRWHLECRDAARRCYISGEEPEFSPYENERPVLKVQP